MVTWFLFWYVPICRNTLHILQKGSSNHPWFSNWVYRILEDFFLCFRKKDYFNEHVRCPTSNLFIGKSFEEIVIPELVWITKKTVQWWCGSKRNWEKYKNWRNAKINEKDLYGFNLFNNYYDWLSTPLVTSTMTISAEKKKVLAL